MAHVSQQKKDTVKKICDLASEYPILGIVNMENLPAKQLQNMREQLRGKVMIFMTKKRLMNVAFDMLKEKKDGIQKLKDYLNGMPALVFTKDNPFKLFKILKKNKSSAPAKAGQTAPNDIIIPAGQTPFAPGPVIGELGALGVKTQVEKGKISIIKDSVACKEGEEISPKLAEMLTRLNILPMEVGLDLKAILEEGILYAKAVLDIDEDKFRQDINSAASNAFNLAVEIAYPAEDIIEFIIQKAFNDSKAIAKEINILTSETIGEVMAKAEMEMNSLKKMAKLDIPKKKTEEKTEKKEEPKKEEKPQEQPKTETKQEKKPETKKEETKPEEKPEKPDMVKKLVEETKKYAKGEIPSAEQIVDEIKKEDKEENKEEKKKEKVPSAHELMETKKKKEKQ